MTSWNKEQEAFIKDARTNGVLLGIPGGGKTRCIIGRIKYRHGIGCLPDQKSFIVMMFSNAACNDFRRKGEDMAPGLFSNDNVRTIHSIAGTILGSNGIQCSSRDTAIYRATELLRESGKDALTKIKILKNVREIYVDEAQDIDENQYRFICTLKRVLDGSVVLVGDPNQSIYGFRNGSSTHLMQHEGFFYQLRINYRSSQHLVDIANRARPMQHLEDMESAVGPSDHQHKTRLVCMDLESTLEQIIIRCKECLAKHQTIAILGPVKRSYENIFSTSINKIGLQLVMAALKENGIPCEIHYDENNSDNDLKSSDLRELSLSTEKVHLFTIHGSKGLEFHHVIFINFHEYLMSNNNVTSQKHHENSCLVYVGLTRAMHSLMLVALKGIQVWNSYLDFSKHVDTVGYSPTLGALAICDQERKPRAYNWVELLRKRPILKDEDLATLEDMLGIGTNAYKNIHFVRTNAASTVELPNEKQLTMLYGICAENLFCNRYRGDPPPCLLQIESMLSNMIVVPRKLGPAVSAMLSHFGFKQGNLIPTSLFYDNTEEIDIDLVCYVQAFLSRNMSDPDTVFLYVPNISRWLDKDILWDLVKKARASPIISVKNIWKMCLFLWQYEVEAAYRLKDNYKAHIQALATYEKQIARMAESLPDGCIFQKSIMMQSPPIRGTIDCIHQERREIIELKFSSTFQNRQAIQALGYSMMLLNNNLDSNVPYKTCIFNLRIGEIAILPKMDAEKAHRVAGILAKIIAKA